MFSDIKAFCILRGRRKGTEELHVFFCHVILHSAQKQPPHWNKTKGAVTKELSSVWNYSRVFFLFPCKT